MPYPRILITFLVLTGLVIAADLTSHVTANTASPPTIEFTKAVYFQTPGGDDVVLGPGTFEVEAVKEGLRLTPKDGKSEDAKVIQSQSLPHAEKLDAPKINSESIGGDTFRMALLLPEGKGLEATGSYSGIRSRGGAYNTAYGSQALVSNTTGSNNAAFGTEALRYNVDGRDNTAMGALALLSNTTGRSNTATGSDTLRLNTTGIGNTAAGWRALYWNTQGNWNTAIGADALSKNTVGVSNTATGYGALLNNVDGRSNTAIGFYTLIQNKAGNYNTAVGTSAIGINCTGSFNTAVGISALYKNTTGSRNTAAGSMSLGGEQNPDFLLAVLTGNDNTAMGYEAIKYNTSGSSNTAIGAGALILNTSGNGNTAIGNTAGKNQTTGSHNIYLNHQGVAGESGAIRIGAAPNQTRAFVTGISGIAVNGAPVMVTPEGQLGIRASSLRYKDDIRDMAEASRDLHKLRPVTFRYKPALAGKDMARQYGLIAEEVAEVYPELVGRTADGEIVTVKYHELIPMLLNEVQKEHRARQELIQENQEHNRQIEEQRQQIQALMARVGELERRGSR